jgi:hypothetical protein
MSRRSANQPRKTLQKKERITTMKRRAFLAALTVSLTVGLLPSVGFAAGQKMTLYKDPQCSCCEIYAQYMRDNGFDVTVVPTNDLATMSEEHGIPANLQGCHLSLIGDYAVGGHVPVDLVKQAFIGHPPIKAITLPGMPAGGPGMMAGVKSDPFTIYAIRNDGSSFVYATQ